MGELFRWNPHADQPHNVAPKKERFKHHFKFAGGYIRLFWSNLKKASTVLPLYRANRRSLYQVSVSIQNPFGVAVSPIEGREEELAGLLEEAGIRQTLVRIPSWERDRLPFYEKFFLLLRKHHVDFGIALLQQREDVLYPSRWKRFMEETISRFRHHAAFFEIGHAWNRTKWGVLDYREYLRLAEPAVSLRAKYGTKLVGPAVIDFEFHLYPPVLRNIPFDIVSSLLYVDRVGAPENTQFGWDTSRKLALLKAIVDGCAPESRSLWITETNWPLQGTGKYSPASGRPNVTEEQQANFLVRYCVLCLSSGFVERVYWWQLVAPGYGLIDSRPKEWRRRPGYFALKTLVSALKESVFLGKIPHPGVYLFLFSKGKKSFAICWTKGKGWEPEPVVEVFFPGRISRVLSRDGQEIPFEENTVSINGSPKYVYWDSVHHFSLKAGRMHPESDKSSFQKK